MVGIEVNDEIRVEIKVQIMKAVKVRFRVGG